MAKPEDAQYSIYMSGAKYNPVCFVNGINLEVLKRKWIARNRSFSVDEQSKEVRVYRSYKKGVSHAK